MGAWHLLLNPARTRRLVVGSVDPIPQGWVEVESFDAESFADAQLVGRHLAPFDLRSRRLIYPRDDR
jgi:hypothetical protein